MKKNFTILSLFILAFAFSSLSRASEYLYNAEVKGMVCAFCAYSVSKNISKLPGVDADSVDVDLKAGHVAFSSNQRVDEQKLMALFSDSGFSISQLKAKELKNESERKPLKVVLKLEIDNDQIEQYSDLLETLGNVAANSHAQLLIEASVIDEDALLKPILMGRQQVIKVRFIDSDNEKDVALITLLSAQ